MSKGYKHLTKQQRIQIEALLLAGHKKTEIAAFIGCSRSSLYREIARGLYDGLTSEWEQVTRYSADIGQGVYDDNATAKGPQLKIGNDRAFVEYVEHEIIENKLSPDAVIMKIKAEGLRFPGMVCTRTLYNYIDSGDIFPHITKGKICG